jgi:hypothetical protein
MTVSAFDFTDRARPIVQIGVGDSRTGYGRVWDTARWDTDAEWSGLEPDWLDVSCDTRSSRIGYGRRAVTDRFVVGEASIVVDNTTGWADPNVLDALAELTVRPGRQIRVAVIHETFGLCVLFRGYIDAMIPTYLPDESDAVELVCIDALGEVNRAKLVALEIPVGASEGGADRINRILDAVGWVPRDVSPSVEPLIATDMGGQVADLLGATADSVGGVVFGDMAGRVAFRGINWMSHRPTDPIDGTIGNGVSEPNRVTFAELNYLFFGDQVVFGVTATDDVCPTAWERPFARADIATRVIVGRDEPAIRVQLDDDTGIEKYGIEPFERTDLLTQSDLTLTRIGARILTTRGESTAPRIRSVSLDAGTSNGALDLMSTVDVYRPSRYRCRLELPRGTVFDDVYFATGVAHDITRTSWTLQLNLDVAEPFAVPGGRWDGDIWDTAMWADLAPLIAEARDLIGAL